MKCGVGGDRDRAGCNIFFLIYHITFIRKGNQSRFHLKGLSVSLISSGSEVPHTCSFTMSSKCFKTGCQVLQHAPHHRVSCNNTRGQLQHNVPEYIGNNGVSSCQLRHFCLLIVTLSLIEKHLLSTFHPLKLCI